MDFSHLKSWMPAAGFDKDGTFYRDVHFKKGKIAFNNDSTYNDKRPICKENGCTVGEVVQVAFMEVDPIYYSEHGPGDEDYEDRFKVLFIGIAYRYKIYAPNRRPMVSDKIFLGFFENEDDAWVAMCDAATEIERELRADMKAGRANKYFTTEHLNATYYPFSGQPKNPEDNGGFYDPATPLFNDQVLPAVAE